MYVPSGENCKSLVFGQGIDNLSTPLDTLTTFTLNTQINANNHNSHIHLQYDIVIVITFVDAQIHCRTHKSINVLLH